VFHIVQEALANIAKYSMAEHAVVTIRKSAKGLEFLVEDDGLGITSPVGSNAQYIAKVLKPSTHFGMEIMQSRSQRLGGSLEVSRIDGGGTRVRLLLPQGPAMGECTA
jgi:nitrate/nitrite-specific signal transduction histidine kinase